MYNYPNYMRPALPAQQIIQVNGKASVDTIQLAPNSSVLVMDTSAPIVWMCVSDGVGRVTSVPYDISIHKEDVATVTPMEQRLSAVEAALTRLEEQINEKSHVGNANGTKSDSFGNEKRQSGIVTHE